MVIVHVVKKEHGIEHEKELDTIPDLLFDYESMSMTVSLVVL